MGEPHETTEHRPDKVKVYRDTAGEWRWRRVAGNGETIADSGEGYVDRDDAIRLACRVNGIDIKTVPIVGTVDGELELWIAAGDGESVTELGSAAVGDSDD